MDKKQRIFVAGHHGMVGGAIARKLRQEGYEHLLERTHRELDLTRQADVEQFFASQRPEFVFLAAARVGGIHANTTYPAEFIYSNLQIQNNCIEAARRYPVKKLLFLGSSCIYPRDAAQPIREESLLTGPLEETNQWYAIAKIAGIRMTQAYRRQYGLNAISLMPTNLYGFGDNFHHENSHVLPALIRRFHEARIRGEQQVVIWGSGQPRREFLFVDDLAEAAIFLMRHYDSEEIINVGVGHDLTIAELAQLIQKIIGFSGELRFDPSKPDGTPVKCLDVSKINALGWKAKISLEEGITQTYRWFLDHQDSFRS
ncbi:MAG: GDP-L-fucose synthase [Magnetococcales bacterium]|nr:GDP-L-fucose synthase [Magnetococcales bacterium]MBF0149164.1 GDP-L-fucose synthase [Magnetococcales bacterium]MBF0172371.1 GDP-L-fucose synthase [Magnetococcales bacterium]MBF0349256.1 GDP-L-fucose synthase [Magnetococcales bacterium]MBF0629643.1 GDP-L-fucose synthase [Magnetococcales bacterium]